MDQHGDQRIGTPIDVDESRDWDIGPLDIILSVLTFPLLMWVLQYAFTGSERIVATRASRYRLYVVLLALEVLIAGALVWWFTR
jgi:hypothetical protein